MVAIKLVEFGGMAPALDSRLLENNAAAEATNTWLYSGALIGINQEKALHTCTLGSTAKTYRIPESYDLAGKLDNSLWLEFANRNTDVIRSAVVNDTFDRYYWSSTSAAPKYNTRARIAYTAKPRTATVTFTNATDIVNWTANALAVGDTVFFTGGVMPTGLTASVTYYVTAPTTNNFKVSTTLSNALQAIAINFTTDGTPTITGHTGAENEFLLGVPAPPTAPTSTGVTGGAAPTSTRAYVVTWVTAYGEEGPPSPALIITGNTDGTWPITFPTVDANDIGINRYLRKARIYRTITSISGKATYYLVTEQDIWATLHSDTAADSVVVGNTQLASTNWIGPPSGLEGWVTMPNGITVGFLNNEIWFSEPFRTHAWPSAYSLATEYPIIGLGVINQTLVVCTAGFPMTVSGVHPSIMTMSRLAAFEPCTSRGSILSTPEGVYYSSFNGLVKVVPGRADNITKKLVTKDEWTKTFNVATIVGARLGTAIYYFGTIGAGVFEPNAFETTAFVQEDTTSARLGVLIDPTDKRVAFTHLSSSGVTVSLFNDQWSGDVFIIRNNIVYWIDPADLTPDITPYLWRSKIFQLQAKGNFGAMKVYFEAVSTSPALNPTPNTNLIQTLAADQYALVRVYADGTHIYTRELRTSGELWRLPGGFKADFYQFEVEGRVRVMSLQAASSPKELTVV